MCTTNPIFAASRCRTFEFPSYLFSPRLMPYLNDHQPPNCTMDDGEYRINNSTSTNNNCVEQTTQIIKTGTDLTAHVSTCCETYPTSFFYPTETRCDADPNLAICVYARCINPITQEVLNASCGCDTLVDYYKELEEEGRLPL